MWSEGDLKYKIYLNHLAKILWHKQYSNLLYIVNLLQYILNILFTAINQFKIALIIAQKKYNNIFPLNKIYSAQICKYYILKVSSDNNPRYMYWYIYKYHTLPKTQKFRNETVISRLATYD